MKIYQYTNQAVSEVLREFNVSAETGLQEKEAQQRSKQYGPNKIIEKKVFWWHILWRQFTSSFIYLLIFAALISYLLAETLNAVLIIIFVLINSALGFYQEYRSEKTLRLLKEYILTYTKVRRGDKEQIILTSRLVPGDIIILETGDKIPADVRLLKVDNFLIDESILSGEAGAVQKIVDPLPEKAKAIYQAANLGLAGSTVVSGQAIGLVLAIGRQSSFGTIARLTTTTKHISGFEKGIKRLSTFVLRLIFLTLTFVFLANIFLKGRGLNIPELLIFSIALAVSVIPEALPLVTTFSLARGAIHLAKRKVVVKRLAAIEDLGSIEILCTDKTGTLTEGSLTIKDLYPKSSAAALLYANLVSAPLEKKIEPFDIALWQGLSQKEQNLVRQYQRVKNIPFDPNRRRNGVLVKKEGQYELVIRGALEAIIPLCPEMTREEKQSIFDWMTKQGQKGHRVLAISRKKISHSRANLVEEEKGLQFLGLISFVDPLKNSAVATIKKAKELGVEIKILTGDSKEVAGSVAEQVKLISSARELISSEDFFALSPEAQREAASRYRVFARFTPEQKYAIIQIFKEKYRVGYLGEGINDAPALKIADISLVVQGAADIAREAADIVLLQKSLKVIVDGIKEGRKVFVNTTKYIKITLASNFGNFYAIAAASLLVKFLPMLPLQILLLNLLSDFPMIAIAADNVDKETIQRPTHYQIKDIVLVSIIFGIVSSMFDFILFAIFFRTSPVILYTAWFIGSVLTELELIFSLRSQRLVFKATLPPRILIELSCLAGLLSIVLPFTAFGQEIFRFVNLTLSQLLVIGSIVITYFICTEGVKLLWHRFTGNAEVQPL